MRYTPRVLEVPDRLAEPSWLSVNVIPAGNFPVSVIVGSGQPVVWMAIDPLPEMVPVLAEVKAGALLGAGCETHQSFALPRPMTQASAALQASKLGDGDPSAG